jgi:uncharacterized membrane protein YfcA
MNIVTILKALSVIGIIAMAAMLIPGIKRFRATEEGARAWERGKKFTLYNCFVSFAANFLDTLGIGSYATTATLYKLRGSVEDQYIPGTLVVANSIPVLIEAFLYFGLTDVEPVTLVSMLAAVVVGAAAGAKLVTGWDVNRVRKAMGIGLIVLGLVMAARQLGIGPFGIVGYAAGLHGVKLVASVIICFFLGALMNIGIGAYAPILALVSLMGMSVKAAFPIMMGGCAFMVPFGNGPVYIKKLRFDARTTVITTFVGTAGVLVAYFLVKSLPLDILFWFVVAAVMFTACIFLRDARRADAEAVRAVPEEIPAGKKAM